MPRLGSSSALKSARPLRLPKEIHLLIRDSTPSWDLRTHGSYYLAIPSVYQTTPDEFWKLACWDNGIGALAEEDNRLANLRWRDIAADCIRRDGFCRHPMCGGRLLEYNRNRMKDAMASEHLKKPYQAARIRGELNFTTLSAHRIFEWIGFRPSRDVHVQETRKVHRKFGVAEDAHLLPKRALLRLEEDGPWAGPPNYHNPLPGIDVADNTGREYLMHHPLAARSFATSVPLDSITFCHIHDLQLEYTYLEPKSKRAVTVEDVLFALHYDLDFELSFWRAKTYVSEHGRCLTGQRWTIAETFERLETLRDLLTVCPLRELKFQCIEESDGPSFSFEQV
ncbi:hypothetical protein C8Q80DRAFT_371446 [Daedaleopsis nitida]|nr:hypothetical protein C8Q80DRAFT_371446 [Daedaleopsis nitida]